jgi:hypothetical protein
MESKGIFVVIAKSVAIGRRSVGSYIPKFTINQAVGQIAKTPTKKEATKIMEHVINVPCSILRRNAVAEGRHLRLVG